MKQQMANVFMCHLEEIITNMGLMPPFYKRYMDDTLVIMPDSDIANHFLVILNSLHENINFTMELSTDDSISFIGLTIKKVGNSMQTQVYHKPTDTGLLLHYQSHCDNNHKKSLLMTMIHRAKELSSTKDSFISECNHLRSTFTRLGYPSSMIGSTIQKFLNEWDSTADCRDPDDNALRVKIPFKGQVSANAVKHQLKDLSRKIGIKVQPVFTSRKLEQDLKHKEHKPAIVNQHCVVYIFKCGQCDADYVGFTTRHLYQRIEEHKLKSSSIGRHLRNFHGSSSSLDQDNFSILKKCSSKWDCLINEMLYINKLKPKLNVQSDSIKAKVFT